MRHRPFGIVLLALMVILAMSVGCRRAVVPPVDELTEEEEALAVIEEAQETVDTELPTETEPPADTPEPPEEPADPTPEPTEVPPDPTPEPVEVTPPPPDEEPTPPPPPEEPPVVEEGMTTYVVQPGDNLFRIALRFNSTVPAIAQANGITNPGLIYVGQTLTVPTGITDPTTPPPTGCRAVHVVRPGDNLFRIALRYNYSQYYLAQVNNIPNPALVYVGQQICIP